MHRNSRLSAPAAALLIALLAAATASAQTEITRKRLGNNVEDITFVGTGPLANSIVTMDGYELYRIPVTGRGLPIERLFEVRDFGIKAAPRGLAHIDSERLFAFVDPSQPSILFLVDQHGQSRGTRTIQYAGGFTPTRLEGVDYIPPNSHVYPDHLVVVAMGPSAACDTGLGEETRIEIVRRDGKVEAEVLPDPPLRCTYTTGVAFRAPDRLMLGTTDSDAIQFIDFQGHVVAPPLATGVITGVEGIAELRDGRVVASDYQSGRLLFFDRQLQRDANDDRLNRIGIGASRPGGIDWDPDSGRFLLDPGFGFSPNLIAAPPALDSSSEIVDLTAAGFGLAARVSYLAIDHKIAIAHQTAPRRILIFDGTSFLQVPVALPAGPLRSMRYIPTTDQFAVRIGNLPPASQQIHFLSRSGALVRSIDVGRPVSGMAFFNPGHPSGGELLILTTASGLVGPTTEAMEIDLNGNALGEYDLSKALGYFFGGWDLCAITSGPYAGAFGLIDLDNSEIVLFRLH